MLRQIKFRVWCISGRQFLSQKDLDNFWVRPHDFNSCFMEWLPDWDGETVFEMKETDFIYQQFTGLLDKNNKEIFEGDIVSQFISPHIANEDEFTKWVENGKPAIKIHRLVKYDGFIIRPFSESPIYPLEPKDVEVIGNIFENPELLK